VVTISHDETFATCLTAAVIVLSVLTLCRPWLGDAGGLGWWMQGRLVAAFYREQQSFPVNKLRDAKAGLPVIITNLVLNDFVSASRYISGHKSYCNFEVAGTFWGSSRTGFHVCPPQLLVSDVMAVSGGVLSAAMGRYNDARVRGLVHFLGVDLGRYFPWNSQDWDMRLRGPGFWRHLPSLAAEMSWFVLFWLVRDQTHVIGDEKNKGGEWMSLVGGYALLLIACGVVSQVSSFRGCTSWMQYSYTSSNLLQEISHDYMPDDGAAPAKLFLTDGGHYENLGLLPLLERECGVILVADCGYDPERRCECIQKAIEVARTKMGASFSARSQDGSIIDVEGAIEEFTMARVRVTPAQGSPGRVAVGQDTTVQRAFNEADHTTLYYGDAKEAEAALRLGDGVLLPTAGERETRRDYLLLHVTYTSGDTGDVYFLKGEVPAEEREAVQREMEGCCCDCCHAVLREESALCCWRQCMRQITGRFPWTSGVVQFYTGTMFDHYERHGQQATNGPQMTLKSPSTSPSELGHYIRLSWLPLLPFSLVCWCRQ